MNTLRSYLILVLMVPASIGMTQPLSADLAPVGFKSPPVKIWPGLAPGTEDREDREEWAENKDVSGVYQPDLTVFLPDKQLESMSAVIVFPGGGYRKLVMRKEGYAVADWFNEHGMAAFVLKYRLDRDEALRDAQRAVSFLRQHAEEYGIDAGRIGVIGFSAGAHLATNLAMNYNTRDRTDVTDDFSSRPDFWVSVYGGFGWSKIPDGTPPAFLVHAANDSKVPVQGSIDLFSALKKKGIPAELHIYEHGEHGFALETNRGEAVTSTVNSWSGRLLEWLKVRAILVSSH